MAETKIGEHSTVYWWSTAIVVVSTWLPHLATLLSLILVRIVVSQTWVQLISAVVVLAVIWLPWYWHIMSPLDELRQMGGTPARPSKDMPPVYPNGWFRVAHSHQLKPGEVIEVSVLGQKLSVFRGEGGDVFVLDAYCAHLGANMAVGGEVKGNCLVCPFHNWSYEGSTGVCVDIPYLKDRHGKAVDSAGKIPTGAKVRRWKTIEQNGVIMIWFDAEGREPMWHPPVIAGVTTGQMVRQGTVIHHANAHIQDISENGVDSAHFNAVHSFPLTVGEKSFGWLIKVVWSNMDWVPQTGPGCTHRADTFIKYHIELCGVDITGPIQVKAEIFGPSIGQIIYNSHFGRVVILVTTCPLGPLRQQATFTVFTDSSIPSLIAKIAMWSFCVMFEQDVPIWSSKRYERQPKVVRGDGDFLAFRRWYKQFYSENSATIQSLRDNLEW